MTKFFNTPPFNRPPFGDAFGQAFGKAFGPIGPAGPPPFNPSDVANLICWYDAALGITLNGPDVSGWADQSGNGNDLAQATPANQPLFVAGSPPFVRFNGSTDFIETMAFASPLVQPNTIIIVYSLPSIIQNGLFYAGIAVPNRNQIQPSGGGTGYFAGGFTSTAETPGPINTLRLNMTVFNVAASKSFYEGGTNTMTGSVGSQTLTGFNFGALPGGGSNFANIDVREALVYDSEVTDTEKNLIGNYEANKFGLTWTDI